MRFVLERVTQPAIEAIALAAMKTHLRAYADQTEEDDLINGLISSAREWLEHYTGRALIDQTWRLSLAEDDWPFFGYTDSNTVTGIYSGVWWPRPDGGIQLRKSPVLGVTSFATVDSAGDETVISAADYEVRDAQSKWPRLYGLNGGSWSAPLRVTFRAGFADRLGSPTQGAEMVPATLIQAMKIWATAMYPGNDVTKAPEIIKIAERIARSERAELGVA